MTATIAELTDQLDRSRQRLSSARERVEDVQAMRRRECTLNNSITLRSAVEQFRHAEQQYRQASAELEAAHRQAAA